MKTTTLLRSFAIFLALVIFAGCSKDNLPSPTGGNFAKSIKIPETVQPDPSNGSIKGILIPVPYKVSIVLTNNNGFSNTYTPYPDGTFLMEYLSPGIYAISIKYVQNPKTPYPGQFDIPGIEVKNGILTSLGDIYLP